MLDAPRDAKFEETSTGHYRRASLRISKAVSSTRRSIADNITPPVREISTRMRFRRDQTIFSEGENCAHFYMVVSGVARTCGYLSDGRRQITGFAFPTDYLGLVLEPTYRNTVEAASTLEVLRYSLSKLAFLADRMPDLRTRLLAQLLRRIQTIENHVLALGRQTARERVAGLFILLFERIGTVAHSSFEIPMRRQDIADYLGLTIETVSREIGRLKREGFIVMFDDHKIVLNDVDALRALSGQPA